MNTKKRSIVPWGLAQVMGPMGVMPRSFLTAQMAFLYNKVRKHTHTRRGLRHRTSCNSLMLTVCARTLTPRYIYRDP
jgi:hypothetical protein